jgi:hypothetical protein
VCVTGSYFGPAESGHTSYLIRLKSTLLSHSRLQFFFSCGVSIRFWVIASLYTASRSHSDTPHSVGLPGRVISPTQRPLPGNTQHTQQTDIHAPGGIRNHNLRKRATSDPHLRPRIHWERLPATIMFRKSFLSFILYSKSALICNPSLRVTCPAYMLFTALLNDLSGKESEL